MKAIQFEKTIIEKDKIDICSESTCFARFTRREFPQLNELEKEIKALRKQLKENNVSLGKTNTLKLLRESKEEYNAMIKEYNETFDNLLVAWSNKLHVGLYVGYGDDEYYNEVLKPLNFKLQKMGYRDNILSKISEITYRVKEIKNELKHGATYTKIWI